jgi:DNA adenine methylase
MNKVTSPVLRYHGGKFRLAEWVMSFFPEHTTYIEPFGGAAGVLLQKPRVYAEVYNDLDSSVANFFRVLRDPESRAKLIELIVMTPYARDEFNLSWTPSEDPIEEARRLCIRAQMGFGSAGATKGATGFRIDTKREYGTAQHIWAHYPSSIAEAGQRLSGVLIENKTAVDVMLQHDSETALHFVDPPYVHSTRVRGASKLRYYRHEMTDADHESLIDVLLDLKGYVVLSGYESEIYRRRLGHWERHTTTARISAGRGCTTRTENIWLNPASSAALEAERVQTRMFA